MPRVLQLLYSRCADPTRELEFNRWYSHTHLPDLSKAPGFVSARRFANAFPSPGAAPYLAVYELDAESAHHALRDLTKLALDAFDAGRHIDCIEGIGAGNSPMGGQWQEIVPSDLEPLTSHDYPPASPEVREQMRSLIDRLTRTLEAES